MAGKITIVKRDTIPPVQAASSVDGESLGERRDFRWHDQLREFMPGPADLSVSWLQLGPGEQLLPRALTVDSLMVVYRGSADVVGDLQRTVAAEDVVVVPSGCRHGFIGGPQGLFALSIQLGEEQAQEAIEPAPDQQHTLASLISYNDARLAQFRQRPIFDLVTSGTLEDPIRRAACRDGLKLWAAHSAGLLIVRQAACTDPMYVQAFRSQVATELARGTSVGRVVASAAGKTFRDPTLVAFADWFTRQMYLLDNVEKVAIVDLVLASANAALGQIDETCRFSENTAENLLDSSLLLRGQSARTYQRLHAIVGEAWDMLGAMTDRMVELTNATVD